MVFTCTRGATPHRAEEVTVLEAVGEVQAILCPAHGVIAYQGCKPTGGTAAVRRPDGDDPKTLVAGEIVLTDGAWWICTPASELLLLSIRVTENPDGTITVDKVIDSAAWKGWLESSVWLAEER